MNIHGWFILALVVGIMGDVSSAGATNLTVCKTVTRVAPRVMGIELGHFNKVSLPSEPHKERRMRFYGGLRSC